MTKFRRFTLALALCIAVAFGVWSARANAPGDVVYAPTGGTEFVGYARTILLQHSGAANGMLLTTFEHWHSDKTPTPFLIERSADGGKTWHPLSAVFDGETGPGHPWPIMFQPFLFELPRALGRYPAGTLLLAGNACPAEANATHFQLWRSRDQGAHWAYVSTFQTGGGGAPGRGIWEPFLTLNRRGDLICYFSDERQWATHSQFLGHIVSTDGGDSWGAEIPDVASAAQADRPGMATVARLPNGRFVMAYEVCGPHNCEVRVKTSPDGETWGMGPADIGTRPETADGRFLANSPYLVWSPAGGPQGTLLLSAQFEHPITGGGLAPENGQVLFRNTQAGNGPWDWTPAPFQPVTTKRGNTNPNYSPGLLALPDGSVRLTAASGGGAFGQERTAVAGAGSLPYVAPFGRGTDAGWITYGGDWSLTDGVYSDTACGAGDKAVAGATGWTDYTLAADVRLTSAGQAGLLVRVSDPAVGMDALHGYYVGLSSDGGSVFVGREDGAWTPLGSTRVAGGIAVGAWYHVTVRVVGASLMATAQRTGGKSAPATLRITDAHWASGAVGLRAVNATASWRNVEVRPVKP